MGGVNPNDVNYLAGIVSALQARVATISSPGFFDPYGAAAAVVSTYLDQAVKQASSPSFVTVKCSALTAGYIPYHVSDAAGLANGPIYTEGTNVLIGATTLSASEKVLIKGSSPPDYHNFQFAIVDGTTPSKSLRFGYVVGSGLSMGMIQAVDVGIDYLPLGINPYGGPVLLGAMAAVGSEKCRVNGDIYVDANCSALSFTDRTPHYEGDALKELSAVKGKDGMIDHATLPKFASSIMRKAIYQDQIVTRQRQKTAKVIKQEKTESVKLIDGKYTRIIATTDKEADDPVFEEADLYDETGAKIIDAKTGRPVIHKIPVMEDYQTTESVKIGEEDVTERNLGAMISMLVTAVQQLAAKVK